MTPTYDFIQEYLQYNSGNECPRAYHVWCALSIIAASVHKRYSATWGDYFQINPNMFIGLIGAQGKTRKSTAKDIAADLFTSTFPNYPLGASVESREQIIKRLSSDECVQSFTDDKGTAITVRPMMLFVNEMKNFFSIDPAKMLDFLTDIYDRKRFKSSTIIRGAEDVENPCLNLLACETPGWIQEKLKGNIISGGFARRIIYVYETERSQRISFPRKPEGAGDMWKRMQEHLIEIASRSAHIDWTDDAMQYWDNWYQTMRIPEDEVMAGYYESKHIQALKVAMGLILSRRPFVPRFTKDILQNAIALLDALEINMPKLFAAAGRNELAVPMQQAMDMLEQVDGWMPEKTFNRMMGKHFSPSEVIQVKNFLQHSTNQIYIMDVKDTENGLTRRMVMTATKYEAMLKKNQKQEPKK